MLLHLRQSNWLSQDRTLKQARRKLFFINLCLTPSASIALIIFKQRLEYEMIRSRDGFGGFLRGFECYWALNEEELVGRDGFGGYERHWDLDDDEELGQVWVHVLSTLKISFHKSSDPSSSLILPQNPSIQTLIELPIWPQEASIWPPIERPPSTPQSNLFEPHLNKQTTFVQIRYPKIVSD
jgi:hypothetical protein